MGYADAHYGAQDAGGAFVALLAVLLAVWVVSVLVLGILAKTVFHTSVWAWGLLRARLATRGVTP